jgi:LysM repeat protein
MQRHMHAEIGHARLVQPGVAGPSFAGEMSAVRVRNLLPVPALAAVAILAALVLAAPAGAAIHVVAAGETLTSVAAADGLSVDQLAAANGLSTTAELISGQTLTIPRQSGSAGSAAGGYTSASTAAAPAGVNEGAYIVQPGDTLTAIAQRAGTSVASLAAVNGLDPNAYLVMGTVLSLNGLTPASVGGSQSVATSVSAPPSTGSVAGTGLPPYPTPETVSAGEVGSIASAQGVSPSLAAAIGWQESGFNNDLVSSTGAAGVMQIEPGTWAWIQGNLASGSLAPASAHDNVLGGVLLLHQLLADTGGDPALAAAGYYQGLASVQQNGVYPSTQAYVNDVLALRGQFGGP